MPAKPRLARFPEAMVDYGMIKRVMNRTESRFKSHLMGLGAIVAITLLTPSPSEASARVHFQEGQKQIAMLTESGRRMVVQINQALESRTKAEIQSHAKEAIRFAEEMLQTGHEALIHLKQATLASDATSEIRSAAYRSMDHLESTMLHLQDAIYMARASLRFNSLQNLLGAIQESATHARHASLHILSEDHAHMEMEAEE